MGVERRREGWRNIDGTRKKGKKKKKKHHRDTAHWLAGTFNSATEAGRVIQS